jgi:uroporphyrinogen decarboxylase
MTSYQIPSNQPNRLLGALAGVSLDRPPIWFMRQAGRYLPEYRELRGRHQFSEAMRNPSVAAEISLQPVRRFLLDAAIVFSDIMTPLTAMGVEIEFTPGPRLSPLVLGQVAALGELSPERVGFVGEAIEMVRSKLDPGVAMIGFAGGPVTLLAYLLEGGGSQHFPKFRSAFHDRDVPKALEVLSRATRAYLQMQVAAGAQVVQLFDTWAGLLSPEQFQRWALPAARQALVGLGVPTIYFAPAAVHLLDQFHEVGATAYGVDWRLPLATAWRMVGDRFPIQGNLDPAVLLADPKTVRNATLAVLDEAGGRTGHVFNLGHGILPETPVANVEAMVETVIGWESAGALSEARPA